MMPVVIRQSKKLRARNVYRGAPLRREAKAFVEKQAAITPEQIAELKAKFLDDLNDWADRSAKSKPGA